MAPLEIRTGDPARAQVADREDLAGGDRLGEDQHLLTAAEVQRGIREGQRAAEHEQDAHHHERQLATPAGASRPGRPGAPVRSPAVGGGSCRRGRHRWPFPQSPPAVGVLIACDSVTVTGTAEAGPACTPRLPPPAAPLAVQVTDQ